MNHAEYPLEGRRGGGGDFASWARIPAISDGEGDADGEGGPDYDVSSIGGPAMSSMVSGIVGLCLTSFLWIVVSWRLFYHYSSWFDRRRRHRGDGLTIKRALHALLFVTMIVEGAAYAIMVRTNAMGKVAYALLDVIGRGTLEYCAFVVGTSHWFDVIHRARSSGNARSCLAFYPVPLAFLALGVIVASAFEAVDLSSDAYPTVDAFRNNSRIYRIA
jgi:hypothetical protein